jgi:CheY-like chemotaxis protein
VERKSLNQYGREDTRLTFKLAIECNSMASAGDEKSDSRPEMVNILLVEPNPGDVRLFEEKFRQEKIFNSINTVSTGEAALEFVNQRGEYKDAASPDIILLDPQLPRKSGIEVLSELRNEPELSEIPVIVLTSSELGEEIVKSHGLDADEYIKKPIEVEEFVAFVQKVEDFWLAIVQNNSEC